MTDVYCLVYPRRGSDERKDWTTSTSGRGATFTISRIWTPLPARLYRRQRWRRRRRQRQRRWIGCSLWRHPQVMCAQLSTEIRSVGRSVGRSVCRSLGRSVGRSVCRSVGRLVGCLHASSSLDLAESSRPWTVGPTDGSMDGWTNGWIDGQMDGRMDKTTDVGRFEWVFVRRAIGTRATEETEFYLEGRTDGRADGRAGGQTDGRTDGRADGRTGGRAGALTGGLTIYGRTSIFILFCGLGRRTFG